MCFVPFQAKYNPIQIFISINHSNRLELSTKRLMYAPVIDINVHFPTQVHKRHRENRFFFLRIPAAFKEIIQLRPESISLAWVLIMATWKNTQMAFMQLSSDIVNYPFRVRIRQSGIYGNPNNLIGYEPINLQEQI